jgi:hypothetical protein
MRRFTDSSGGTWEVVAGRESWGAFVALFVPTEDGVELRQAPLLSSSFEHASAELDAMGETALGELLARSVPNVLGD